MAVDKKICLVYFLGVLSLNDNYKMIDVWYFIHYLKDNQTEYVEAKLRSPWHQEVII